MKSKNKYYISVDTELYNALLKIATANQIAMSDLIKLISNINVKTVQLRDFNHKTTRISYYSYYPLLRLSKINVNYKILKFLELYDGNFA